MLLYQWHISFLWLWHAIVNIPLVLSTLCNSYPTKAHCWYVDLWFSLVGIIGLNNIYSNIKHQFNCYNVMNSGFSNKIKSYLKLSPEEGIVMWECNMFRFITVRRRLLQNVSSWLLFWCCFVIWPHHNVASLHPTLRTIDYASDSFMQTCHVNVCVVYHSTLWSSCHENINSMNILRLALKYFII